MSMITIAEIMILPLLIVALLTLPVLYVIRRNQSKKTMRRAMITNLCVFFGVLLCAVIFPAGGALQAFAAEAAEETASNASGISAGLGYLAAALAVGVGSIGCGIAVGNAAPAAIGAIAEEPKAFGKALIFVALGEGVAIYGLLIAIMILGKL